MEIHDAALDAITWTHLQKASEPSHVINSFGTQTEKCAVKLAAKVFANKLDRKWLRGQTKQCRH